jgi:hypothetical protein
MSFVLHHRDALLLSRLFYLLDPDSLFALYLRERNFPKENAENRSNRCSSTAYRSGGTGDTFIS